MLFNDTLQVLLILLRVTGYCGYAGNVLIFEDAYLTVLKCHAV